MARFPLRLLVVVATIAAAAGHPVADGYAEQMPVGFGLYPQFYEHTCPQAEAIIKSVVEKAVAADPRNAASLLRMHFHDCFVQGCDASVLLDSTGAMPSEKRANPNKNSLRGFEIIDEIKAAVEEACPLTVSCADIVAVVARDSTVLAGGPWWEVPLGRRDSLTASLAMANNNIPAPNGTLPTIVGKFYAVGLDLVDVVALSGAHTIGDARCATIRQRLYNQNGNGQPDFTLAAGYAEELRYRCPPSGGDQNLFALDFATQFKFDNQYYRNLVAAHGLLNSDEVLYTQSGETRALVEKFAESNELFFEQFARSMLKMGSISPLTGYNGEVRKHCRKVNYRHGGGEHV